MRKGTIASSQLIQLKCGSWFRICTSDIRFFLILWAKAYGKCFNVYVRKFFLVHCSDIFLSFQEFLVITKIFPWREMKGDQMVEFQQFSGLLPKSLTVVLTPMKNIRGSLSRFSCAGGIIYILSFPMQLKHRISLLTGHRSRTELADIMTLCSTLR